jgi:succinate dehydrogenase/fumarate reductase flavoprotein subunit
MTITYALMQAFEKLAETSERARIVNKARVHDLIVVDGNVVGCIYEKAGVNSKEFGPVVLCSGGFGADFTSDSLLAKHRPDLLHLPTTNGEHCTGDAIKMGEKVGAETIDLEWVQVHPTGLVKPDDPDAKVKFLAAEALRGVGGLIFDANGKRFANEVGRRDYVTGEMWKNKPPFHLTLNSAAATEMIWHAKHYTGRGVMKHYESGAAFAKDIGVPLQTLVDEHQRHFEAGKKMEKDPDGGPFPAYPSGKCWDEPSGKTGSGKKFYANLLEGSKVEKEPFYVAIITPVIHYCMGGLLTTPDGEVVAKKGGKALPGLFVAGEAAGGVHGNNRLGGNSLLDCVVFGRVAGRTCSKYIAGADGKYRMYPIDANDKRVSNVVVQG